MRPNRTPLLAWAAALAAASFTDSRSQAPARERREVVQPAAARQVLGDLPGTQRWNVTFRTRDFDLAEFRGAIHAAESAETVGAIVKDLEVRARRHQEPFRRTIETLGGKVVRQFWLINAATVDVK